MRSRRFALATNFLRFIVSFQFVRRNRMGWILTVVIMERNGKFSSTFYKMAAYGHLRRCIVQRLCVTVIKHPCLRFPKAAPLVALRRGRNILDKTIFERYKGNFFTKKVSLKLYYYCYCSSANMPVTYLRKQYLTNAKKSHRKHGGI